MADLDRMSVTAEAIAQMAKTPDPRMREVMAAAIRHLHDFAREVDLKPDEWLAGIAFLTAVGQACTPYRQEFILLSDVLGLSRLVNVMHDAEGREAAGTETSLSRPLLPREGAGIRTGRKHRRAFHRWREAGAVRHGDRCRGQAGAGGRDRHLADRRAWPVRLAGQ
ncbi:dioxygenase [Dankookia sp. P2]|uniref:dioxygenase n=1 Tax=Dankookia sp. P2 TaxID=3423955 RepID=UPI003D67DC47